MRHIVSVHFNLLAYHGARYNGFLNKFRGDYRLSSLLLRPSKEYELFNQDDSPGNLFGTHRLGLNAGEARRTRKSKIRESLDALKPTVLLMPGGYSEPEMQQVILYGAERKIPMILCSATKANDAARIHWRESVKKAVVAHFSAVLVGGKPQFEYMMSLGMRKGSVFVGYDVVDNAHFRLCTKNVLGGTSFPGKRHLPESYFIVSARFVAVKNLPNLFETYACYRERCPHPWDMVLIGDGPLRDSIVRLRKHLGLEECIHLPGFVQYADLPELYHRAKSLIHASFNETWGLVVNEAMASGLPVLVSNRCGCARELVQEGVNGFTFDPYDTGELTNLMCRISEMPEAERRKMGKESEKIIENWGPDRFAQGLKSAVDKALEIGPPRVSTFDRILLKMLLLRG